MGGGKPVSFMVQDEWFDLLRQAEPSHEVNYHLAINWYYRKDYERAEALVGDSDAWDLQLKANILRASGRLQASAKVFERAMQNNVKLTVEAFKTMREAGEYQLIVANAEYAKVAPMAEFLLADALAHTGKLEEAEELLAHLDIPDIREGEISVSELYVYIQMQKAAKGGTRLCAEDIDIPYQFDFRMTQKRPENFNRRK